MKGMAARAPTPLIRPLIEPILGSSLSDNQPPRSVAGRPPPIMIMAFMTENYVMCSGKRSSKNFADRKPRLYPPKNLIAPAIKRYMKHELLSKMQSRPVKVFASLLTLKTDV